MIPPFVFIHGAWLNSRCWENFQPYFSKRGFECLAPDWPCKERPVEEQRLHPARGLARLGLEEIVDSLERQVRGLDRPPVLVGHGFGGLAVQMLLDRGLGEAGIAIAPAAPKGVLAWRWPALRSAWPVVKSWGASRRVVTLSQEDFRRFLAPGLGDAEAKAAYERYVVPESGRVLFEGMVPGFREAAWVCFQNDERPPLLILAGSADLVCPPAQARENLARYAKSLARTDFKEFPQRSHWAILEPGWQDIADYILDWVEPLLP